MRIYLAGTSIMKLTNSPKHSHKYHEVILNTEGEGVALIGGESYPFAPGTIHIIPPDTDHWKESPTGFRDIYFISDAESLGSYSTEANRPTVLQDDEKHTLEQLMSVMVTRFQKQKRYDPILQSTHQAILHQIKEWRVNDAFDSTVEEIIARIDNSFTQPDFTVTDALKATGYNVDYIRRTFFAATGMTPNHYLTHQRLKFARHLLWHQEQLNLSVGEIAALSGYYDVSYFSRLFKKAEGMTPKEFAATHRANT